MIARTTNWRAFGRAGRTIGLQEPLGLRLSIGARRHRWRLWQHPKAFHRIQTEYRCVYLPMVSYKRIAELNRDLAAQASRAREIIYESQSVVAIIETAEDLTEVQS